MPTYEALYSRQFHGQLMLYLGDTREDPLHRFDQMN